jgi:hypothetical protein
MGSVWSDKVILLDVDAGFFRNLCVVKQSVTFYVFVRLCTLSRTISCDGAIFSPCAEIQRCGENDEIGKLH